jgi:hypothetical protein
MPGTVSGILLVVVFATVAACCVLLAVRLPGASSTGHGASSTGNGPSPGDGRDGPAGP